MAMIFVVMVVMVASWGCATASDPVPKGRIGAETGQTPDEAVLAALERLHRGLKSGDIEGSMAAVSDDFRDSRGGDKSGVRETMESLIAQGAFASTAVNMEACEIVVTGGEAVARPVVYESSMGSSAQEFRLRKEGDGVWRIVDSEWIPSPSVDVWTAAATGNLAALKQHVAAGTDLNALDPTGGSTPLNLSALLGQTSAARFLIQSGSDVDARGRDGNTALHTAAFLCQTDTVRLLLDAGADRAARGASGQTALESVTGPWTEELEGIYQYIAGIFQMQLDLERIKAARPKIAALLSR